MRPEQAGPEGDEIVEQECSAFWWIQAMDTAANRNQIFEHGGGRWERGVPLGVPVLFISSPVLGLCLSSFTMVGEKSGFVSLCAGFPSFLFDPFSLQMI